MTAAWESWPVPEKRSLQRVLHQKLYRDDPVAWVHDCIDWPEGEGPSDYQEHILQSLVDKKRVAVRAPRGAGKTTPAAWATLWFADTRDGEPWKVVVTAGTWLQLHTFLWPEIHRWVGSLRWDRLAREPYKLDRELKKASLTLSTGEAFAISSSDPNYLEGAHAANLLAIVDEGKAVPDDSWDAVEGFFSDPGDKYALALSTPAAPVGRFHDIHARRPGFEDWHPIHVTADEAIQAGRVTQGWVDQRRMQWGAESTLFRTQVLAEFGGEEDGIIPLSWVEAAMDRWSVLFQPDPKQPANLSKFKASVVGVDVAEAGADVTAIATRHGWTIGAIHIYETGDPLMTADRTRRHAPDARAVVDSIGLGSGTLAALKRSGVKAEGFVAGGRTKYRDKNNEFGFINIRAAAWWSLRELLDPSDGEPIALPRDDRLLGDLTAPHWREAAGGKIQVESKGDIRKRLGRSTDSADAVVQAFWEEKARKSLEGWTNDMGKESVWNV